MNSKNEKSIMNMFLIFFMGYSIISIWLGIITKSFTSLDRYITLAVNLLQIIGILLLLINKNIGTYIFLATLVLNILIVLNTSTDISHIFSTIICNICIMVAFLIFNGEKS